MARRGHGESTIYLGKDGSWHGRVTVGIRDDGSSDRRHIQNKKKQIVVTRVRELERQRDTGTLRNVGPNWTVESWLTHWLEHIAAPFVKVNTLAGYRVAVNVHLIPGLGKHKLSALRPEHVERFYVGMLSKPTRLGPRTSPSTVHHAHRTLRAALNEAVRRGHLTKNPVLLARTPTREDHEVQPYSLDEVQLIFQAATKQRNTARWVIALSLGLRQGEALGLQWDDINLVNGTMAIRRGRLRPKYEHGCGGVCGRAAGWCPKRIATRSETNSTKSRSGRRIVGLPDALSALLMTHRENQQAEREQAGSLWHDGGWVFTDRLGRPINPRTDWDRWKQLLRAAGVREGRLHDARHTAATMLVVLGVSDRTIMGMMGWSNTSMTQRYGHIVDPIRRDVAGRLDALLWSDDEPQVQPVDLDEPPQPDGSTNG